MSHACLWFYNWIIYSSCLLPEEPLTSHLHRNPRQWNLQARAFYPALSNHWTTPLHSSQLHSPWMLSSGFSSIYSRKLLPHHSASLGCMRALQTSLQGDQVAYCSLTHNGLLMWLYFFRGICACSGSYLCVCIEALTRKKISFLTQEPWKDQMVPKNKAKTISH